jgi:hypothetical protein
LWVFKKTKFNYQRKGSAQMLISAFHYIKGNQIQGDFCEFGTLFGDISIDAFYLNTKLTSKRELFFFDSFEGLPNTPEPYDQKILEPGSFAFSLKNFRNRLKKFGVDIDQVHIIPGFFSKTLVTRNDPLEIAIAWVDCDLYSSTLEVLDFLTARLSQGSLLILDDYFLFDQPSKGQRLAVAEWLRKNPHIQLTHYRDFHWAGRAFIFNYAL